jgi:hypothetical protein
LGTISSSYTIQDLDFVGQWVSIEGAIAKNGSISLPSSGIYVVITYKVSSNSYIPSFSILNGGNEIYNNSSTTYAIQGLIQRIA